MSVSVTGYYALILTYIDPALTHFPLSHIVPETAIICSPYVLVVPAARHTHGQVAAVSDDARPDEV